MLELKSGKLYRYQGPNSYFLYKDKQQPSSAHKAITVGEIILVLSSFKKEPDDWFYYPVLALRTRSADFGFIWFKEFATVKHHFYEL